MKRDVQQAPKCDYIVDLDVRSILTGACRNIVGTFRNNNMKLS